MESQGKVYNVALTPVISSMAVKECYRNELDIKYSERKKDKQSYSEWTQGPYFSFAEGHLFYDTPQAYRKKMGTGS